MCYNSTLIPADTSMKPCLVDGISWVYQDRLIMDTTLLARHLAEMQNYASPDPSPI